MASKAPGAGGKKPVKKTTVAATPRAVAATKAAPAPEPVVKPASDFADVPPVPVVPEAVAPVVEAAIETARDVSAPGAEFVEDSAAQTAETVAKEMDIMESTIEKSQAMFADMNERAKAAVEKNTKLVGEFTEFAKGNVEALVESGKIAAKGFETLGQDVAEYNRKSFESATATLKSLAAVKSPADFFKMQSDFVRQSFDSVVAETSKNTEAFIKLAGDAAQPISNRVAVAVEKVKAAA